MKRLISTMIFSVLIMSHFVTAASLTCPNKYIYSGLTSQQTWPSVTCGNSTCSPRYEGGYVDIHLNSKSVTITKIENYGMRRCYSSSNACDKIALKSVGTGYWRLETDPNDKRYLKSAEFPNYNLLTVEGYGTDSSIQFTAELRQNTGAIIQSSPISVPGKLQPTTSWDISDVVFDDLEIGEEKFKSISGPTGSGTATLKKTKDSSYVSFKINGSVPSLNVVKSIPNNQTISLSAVAGQTPGKGIATYTATLTCP